MAPNRMRCWRWVNQHASYESDTYWVLSRRRIGSVLYSIVMAPNASQFTISKNRFGLRHLRGRNSIKCWISTLCRLAYREEALSVWWSLWGCWMNWIIQMQKCIIMLVLIVVSWTILKNNIVCLQLPRGPNLSPFAILSVILNEVDLFNQPILVMKKICAFTLPPISNMSINKHFCQAKIRT